MYTGAQDPSTHRVDSCAHKLIVSESHICSDADHCPGGSDLAIMADLLMQMHDADVMCRCCQHGSWQPSKGCSCL